MPIQQTARCANLDRMSPGKTQRTHRLFAIAVSHYSEKARWALSYYRVPYQQQLLLPWLHIFSVKTIVDAQVCVRQSRDTRSSPYSTPCLAIYDDSGLTLKESLHDSHDVLVYLSENFVTVDSVNLYTSCGQTKEEEIQALEKHYDETLGVAACNFFYLDMLRFARWRSILPFATMGFKNKVGLLQSLIWFALSPILGRLIISAMGMGSSHHDAMQTCREIFHHASELLEQSPYLAGDHLSAADITLAALSFPVLGITHQEGNQMYPPSSFANSPEGKAFKLELRATKAGQHVLRLFKEERFFGTPLPQQRRALFGLW